MSLKEQAQKLSRLIDESLTLELTNEDEKSMRSHKARIRRSLALLDKRPGTAIYGQSQVGKSFLVNRLFSQEGAPVMLDFDGNKLGFIKDINPVGIGQEATGVVSRFTIVAPASPPSFPVSVELLTPAELVLILADSYKRDAEKEVEVNVSAENMPQRAGLGLMDENEVSELREACDRLSIHVKDDYWDETRRHLSGITSNVNFMTQWFSELWGRNELFSEVLKALLAGYVESGITPGDRIHVELNGVLKEAGTNIVDVGTLRTLLEGHGGRVKCIQHRNEFELDAAVLAGLTREVIMPLQSDEIHPDNSFIQQSDFLDFPGARNFLQGGEISDESVMTYFLRAKVRHLFYSYAVSKEVENLLWCWDGQNMDAYNQVWDVNFWLGQCIGEGREARSKYVDSRGVDPLAVVQTKFNTDMALLEQPQSASIRVQNRMWDYFKVILGNHSNWFDDWTLDRPNFDGIHFLRDPKFSDGCFEGYDEKAGSFLEDRVKEGLEEAMGNFYQILRSNVVLEDHCAELEGKWKGISVPNQVGIGSILSFLNKAGQNSGIKTKMKFDLEDVKQDLITVLGTFAQDENFADQLKSAIQNWQELFNEFRKATMNVAISQQPGRLVGSGFLDQLEEYLSTSVEEVIDFYADVEVELDKQEAALRHTEFLQVYEGFRRDMSLDERQRHFSGLLGNDVAEADVVCAGLGIDLERLFPEERIGSSHLIVEQIVGSLVTSKFRDGGDVEVFLSDCGISSTSTRTLFQAFRTGVNERNLGRKISESIDMHYRAQAGVTQLDGAVVARSIAFWWNEFIFKCDHRFFTADEMERLQIDPLTIEGDATDYRVRLEHLLSDPETQQPRIARLKAWCKGVKNIMHANTNAIDLDEELLFNINNWTARASELNFE